MKRKISRDLAAMQRGIDAACNCITSTMGPEGRLVLIEREGNLLPLVTKDGATVAENIDLSDPVENAGFQIIREASAKTALTAGDGTTTAACLSQAIFNAGRAVIEDQADDWETSVRDMKEGMSDALGFLLSEIEKEKVEIDSEETLLRVAQISANGEKETAQLIIDAINAANGGEILVADSNMHLTRTSVTSGYTLERGFMSPHFMTDVDRSIAEYENPHVLLVSSVITSLQQILFFLEFSHGKGEPLLIVGDFEPEALQSLAMNKQHAGLKVLAIKPPGTGQSRHDMLQDMSCLVGSQVWDVGSPLSVEKYLGSIQKVSSTHTKTVIIPHEKIAKGEAIKDRISNLREIQASSDDRKAEEISYRIRQLNGTVVTIHVGGLTEAESFERKDRVEDALRACLCALSSGVLPGCGTALWRASLRLKLPKKGTESYISGFNAMLIAAKTPFEKLTNHLGLDEDQKRSLRGRGKVVDIRTKRQGNFLKLGVIDPFLVTSEALKNAAAAAMLLLSVDSILVIDE